MDELLSEMAKIVRFVKPAEDLTNKINTLAQKVIQEDKYCLHRAIKSKDYPAVLLLLEFGASPDRPDTEGNTPLHNVSHLNWLETAFSMALMLIRYGANVMAKDASRLPSHYYAVKQQNIELLKLLVRHGIDHEVGFLALQKAVLVQNLEMVQLLINETPHLSPKNIGACLHYPIYNNAELVQLLIDSGADMDVIDPVLGTKPLNVAASSGYTATVEILLNACADIDHVAHTSQLDGDEYNPGSALHDAAFHGHFDIVELLVDHKANVNALNQFGESVLYVAANLRNFDRKIHNRRYLEILEHLLYYEADMHRYGECGNYYMPFKAVFEDGHMDAVDLFLEYGANIEDICVDDEFENTILHLAARNEDSSVLEFALKARPNDIDKICVTGLSPLSVAVIHNIPGNVELLLKNGADVNCLAVEKSRHGPLYLAVTMVYKECVQILLDNGAAIDYKTKTNEDVSILASALTSYPNDHSAYKLIVEHIALIEKKGVHVDPRNQSLMKSKEGVWKYYEMCESELVKMQDSVIDGHITFYRILVDKDIRGYARNQKVINAFENQNIESDFPVYGHRIAQRVALARKKAKLLNDATKGLSSVLYFDVSAHHMIYENILKYVSDEDLLTLGKLPIKKVPSRNSNENYSAYSPYFHPVPVVDGYNVVHRSPLYNYTPSWTTQLEFQRHIQPELHYGFPFWGEYRFDPHLNSSTRH
ncbi:hypothetical protein QAD02_015299 [Eretmocerus hayati]|uniref:Uncharacterized protein n=1 Tax=Eretmocerus hayati TaxID=131215 RepID=A0ACC2PAN2_9HYME|nr:hypothetical protein QAD02_015299 [Eretmocerus hayati]